MKQRREFNRRLATLYPSASEARRILSYTEIPIIEIDMTGSPLNIWNDIIVKSQPFLTQFIALLKIILEEYPSELVIKEGLNRYLSNSAVPDPVPIPIIEDEEPFSEVIKLIDRNKFGPLRRVDCNRSEQFRSFVRFSQNKNLTIAYVIGSQENNPKSFPERIILDKMKNYPTKIYRRYTAYKDNEDRHDHLPFDIHPDLETSKNLFRTEFELLNQGIRFENDQLVIQSSEEKIDMCAYSINYNFEEGQDILKGFTKWLSKVLNSLPDTSFHFFFVFSGLGKDQNESQKIINSVMKDLGDDQVMSIELFDPVDYNDITAWQAKIGAANYERSELIKDFELIGVQNEAIEKFKQTENISFKQFEKFTEDLYKTIVKS